MGIPSTIVKTYEYLCGQRGWLNQRWTTYCELYGMTEQRVRLLNAAAPSFFFVVQESLFDDVILSICRVALDPATSWHGKIPYKNLNLARLILDVEATGDGALADQLKAELRKVKRGAAQLRTYRDKHLAHCDLEAATQVASLSGPSRKRVKLTLARISRMLDLVDAHYGEPPALPLSSITHGGPQTLVGLIKAGMRYYALLDEEVIPVTDDPRGEWGNA